MGHSWSGAVSMRTIPPPCWGGLQPLTQQRELPQFKFRYFNASPPPGGAFQGSKGQLQAAALVEEARDYLGAAALLGKATLDQVGGAHITPMRRRQAQEPAGPLHILGESVQC